MLEAERYLNKDLYIQVSEIKEKLCHELEKVQLLKGFDDLLKEELSKEVSSQNKMTSQSNAARKAS